MWNRYFVGTIIAALGLLLITYIINYNSLKKYDSPEEEYEYKYLSFIKSNPDYQTKIILLYTKFYNNKWGILAGNEIFSRLRCPLTDCYITNVRQLQNVADAVIFHMRDNLQPRNYPYPKPAGQKWIFYLLESPYHIWDNYSKFNGLFDWTSTYTTDSDIPAPYGRYDPFPASKRPNISNNGLGLPHSPINYAASKSQLALWMVSHCSTPSGREKVAQSLALHIQIHVYGCKFKPKLRTRSFIGVRGARDYNRSAPGFVNHGTSEACGFEVHPTCLRTLGPFFKFYLAFENSLCREYITEKFWYNALAFGMVPVVMGAPKSDYLSVAPPGSFIHVDDFAGPRQLATYLTYLDGNDTAYSEYHGWRTMGTVTTEVLSNPAQSRFWCSVCQRLHAQNGSTANDSHSPNLKLETWWSPENMCRARVD